MRKEYEMSEEQYKKILEACKPVVAMMIGGTLPRSPGENANDAWNALGKEMGFIGGTAKPLSNSKPRFFTAEAIEEYGVRVEDITDVEWRDLYYLYRALHDGLCPNCGHEDNLIVKYHRCNGCGFSMSDKQVSAILAKSKEILKRRLTSFDRVGKALE